MLVVCLLLMTTACGRKGALIYPDMLAPAATTAVTAFQSGSVIKLQFILSGKDQGGRPVQGVTGVKISKRSVAEADQNNVCRNCTIDYRLFRTLYLEHLPATTQRIGNMLTMLDGDVSAGNTYSYSIVPFTAGGVDGASFATADVHVTAPSRAPLLKLESLPTEVKVHISMNPPVPGNLLGYNLYRTSVASERSYLPLNREPFNGNEYVDTTLERGVKYRYTARALIRRTSGESMESAESEEVEGMLKDDE